MGVTVSWLLFALGDSDLGSVDGVWLTSGLGCTVGPKPSICDGCVSGERIQWI